MARQTINDDSLAESLFEVFRTHGYESASIAQLSEATGLKKSSLYHRFPAGKEDMVKAVVLHISAQLQAALIKPLLSNQYSPLERFTNMIVSITRFYFNGNKNCLLNVLSIGIVNQEIRSLLNNDYNSWRDALINLARETGLSAKESKVRAEHFLIIVQGALVIQRVTENKQTFKQSMEYGQVEFFRLSKPEGR